MLATANSNATPDLRSYDRIVVSSSAGKDSQAMLDHVCTLAAEAGVLDRVVVVHCDLGRVEWANTRELAEAQAQRYGVRFIAVRRPQGDLLQHVQERGKWMSPKVRYCTSDHKRGQVAKVYTQLAAECGSSWRQVRLLSCMGMRAQESPARSKLQVLERNARQSNGRRVVDDWLPVHSWTVEQVWERIRSCRTADLVHVAYSLGMPRLSCVFCIYAPKEALVLAGTHNRALLAEYVRVEREIGHTFKADLSLAQVEAEVEAAAGHVAPVADWRM